MNGKSYLQVTGNQLMPQSRQNQESSDRKVACYCSSLGRWDICSNTDIEECCLLKYENAVSFFVRTNVSEEHHLLLRGQNTLNPNSQQDVLRDSEVPLQEAVFPVRHAVYTRCELGVFSYWRWKWYSLVKHMLLKRATLRLRAQNTALFIVTIAKTPNLTITDLVLISIRSTEHVVTCWYKAMYAMKPRTWNEIAMPWKMASSGMLPWWRRR
jgi:hypothetical protein